MENTGERGEQKSKSDDATLIPPTLETLGVSKNQSEQDEQDIEAVLLLVAAMM
jgi:hypothetical protein